MDSHDTASALFVDYENIRYGFYNACGREISPRLLMSLAQQHGQVLRANAYADFDEHPEMARAALEVAGIRPMNVPKLGRRNKQSVDMAMLMDVFECLVDFQHIQTLILMTGDSDFLRIVAYARTRFRRKVVVIGIPGTVSRALQQAADVCDFIPLADAPPAGKRATPSAPASSPQGAAPLAGGATALGLASTPGRSPFASTQAHRRDVLRLIWILDLLENSRPFVSFKYLMDYITNPLMPIHTECPPEQVAGLLDQLVTGSRFVLREVRNTENGDRTHYALNRANPRVTRILQFDSLDEVFKQLGL
ncbi:MAG: hypothetical protein OHK0052_22790 [Anaerolineales bacterium]